MNLFSVPWLELTIFVPLAGALGLRFCREPNASQRWGLVITALTLLCAGLAWLGYQTGANPGGAARWELIPKLFGFRLFELDELNAPLLPLVALLHFLTVLATTGAKATR